MTQQAQKLNTYRNIDSNEYGFSMTFENSDVLIEADYNVDIIKITTCNKEIAERIAKQLKDYSVVRTGIKEVAHKTYWGYYKDGEPLEVPEEHHMIMVFMNRGYNFLELPSEFFSSLSQ